MRGGTAEEIVEETDETEMLSATSATKLATSHETARREVEGGLR